MPSYRELSSQVVPYMSTNEPHTTVQQCNSTKGKVPECRIQCYIYRKSIIFFLKVQRMEGPLLSLLTAGKKLPLNLAVSGFEF